MEGYIVQLSTLSSPSKTSAAGLMLIATAIFASTAIDAWLLDLDWHNQQRAGQLILLATAAAVAMWRPLQTVSPLTFSLTIAALLLGAYSSIRADYPAWAFKELSIYAGSLITALLIGNAAKVPAIQSWLIRFFLISTAATAWMFATYYSVALHIETPNLDPYLLLYGFDNPRFLGQLQVLLLPILLAKMAEMRDKKSAYWPLIFALLIMHWCIAWSLGGRGMLAAAFTAHFVVILIRRSYWRIFAGQAVVAAFGLLLHVVLFVAIPDWMGIDATTRSAIRSSLSGRETIWLIAWEMFTRNPILGTGPLHYSAVWNHIAAHPHQLLLQWLAEWGALATIVLVTISVKGLLHGARFIQNESKPIDVAIWIGIVSALLLAQVDGMLVMPYPSTWLAIICGLALARWTPALAPSLSQTCFFRCVGFTVFILITNILLTELPHLKKAEQAFHETNEIGSPPRLWSQGWIPMPNKSSQ
ncbi:O-antigen ligase family protein [Stutzerimonas marianensis]